MKWMTQPNLLLTIPDFFVDRNGIDVILFTRRQGMLAKLTTKNQITLPRDVVKEFKGIDYFDAKVQDGRIVLEPVVIRPLGSDLPGIRRKMERLGVSEADVDEAIRWSRKKPA
jgi:hypothetical protein